MGGFMRCLITATLLLLSITGHATEWFKINPHVLITPQTLRIEYFNHSTRDIYCKGLVFIKTNEQTKEYSINHFILEGEWLEVLIDADFRETFFSARHDIYCR